MIFRDFNHFAGSFAPTAKVHYGISISTIVDVAHGRTWVAVALTNRSCTSPRLDPLIMGVALAVPNVAITGDDQSDPGIQPRLIDGATKHGAPKFWNWYQNRTVDHKGFNLELKAMEPSGGILSCEVPAGHVDYNQTCCGGWAVFEFNTRGIWSVSDIGWGTIDIANPPTSCNFMGDASRSALSTLPGSVCGPA